MTTTVTPVGTFNQNEIDMYADEHRGEPVGTFDLHMEIRNLTDHTVHVKDARCVGYVKRDVTNDYDGPDVKRDILVLWDLRTDQYHTIVGWENNQPTVPVLRGGERPANL